MNKLGLAVLCASFSMIVSMIIVPSAARAFDQSHAVFDRVLQKYVVELGKSTRVKYKDLKASPQELGLYLKELSSVTQAEYEKFSHDEKLAFLINAYNGFTLQLIIDHYPVKSIKDIGGLLSSPWKKEFFKLFGKDFHLDKVEHGMIRKDFDEPRIHFAVNCASIGCPSLMRNAFTASGLEGQLQKATQAFVLNPELNRYNASKSVFEISSIFKWYGSDFNKKYGNHGVFIAQTLGLSAAEIEKAKKEKIPYEYLDYDWNLNEFK